MIYEVLVFEVQQSDSVLSVYILFFMGFPRGSAVKNPPANAGDLGSIPGLGRFPREGNGNQLQYSCLESPMDRGAWWATVCGIAKSQTGLSPAHSNTVLSMRSHSSNDAVLLNPALRLTSVFLCSIIRILTSLNRLSSCLRYNF